MQSLLTGVYPPNVCGCPTSKLGQYFFGVSYHFREGSQLANDHTLIKPEMEVISQAGLSWRCRRRRRLSYYKKVDGSYRSDRSRLQPDVQFDRANGPQERDSRNGFRSKCRAYGFQFTVQFMSNNQRSLRHAAPAVRSAYITRDKKQGRNIKF